MSEPAILPPHLQSGKAAFRELVTAFGGQDACAVETGRSQQRIAQYCGRNTRDFVPLDVVDALEDRTAGLPGWPHVTRWLARRRGCELVALPDPAITGGAWGAMVSALAKQAGELVSGVAADLTDDNDVSPAEARARLSAAAELIRVAVELQHALAQRAEE